MARLQILELPSGSSDERPPFLLVIDEYEPMRYVQGFGQEAPVVDEFKKTAALIGARTVLVFRETVTIPANAPLPATAADERELTDVQRDLREPDPELADLVFRTLGIEMTPGDIPVAEILVSACRQLEKSEAARKYLRHERADARMWARHGYEIGQKHCGWTDHGVAPNWLTEGWPPHIDGCEHLKKAAEYDTALSRVLEVAADLEAAEAHGGVWDANQQAAMCIRAAVGQPRDEEARKP